MSRLLSASAAVALGAVVVAGCSPERPSPSARVLVSRVSGSVTGGSALAAIVVPDAKDGVANQNPPGTVEVFSVAPLPVLTLDTSTTNPCGHDALHATVRVKNYATEQLQNVYVQWVSVAPVSHVICTQPSGVPPEITSTLGVVGYASSLTGSPVPDGSAPGGYADADWWIDDQTQETFTFTAKVWADVVPAPPTGGSPGYGTRLAAGSATPTLSWTGSTPDGRVELATDPAFANTVEMATVTGTSSGSTYAFSYVPALTPDGARRYWWRARNRFVQPGGSALVDGTFLTGGSFLVDAAPANLIATRHSPTTYTYTLAADSWAPRVDFYAWNFAVSATGPYYTASSPFWDWGSSPSQSGQTFSVWTYERYFDGTGNPPPFSEHWRACTQYGAAYSLATQGACATGPDINF